MTPFRSRAKPASTYFCVLTFPLRRAPNVVIEYTMRGPARRLQRVVRLLSTRTHNKLQWVTVPVFR